MEESRPKSAAILSRVVFKCSNRSVCSRLGVAVASISWEPATRLRECAGPMPK